MTQLRKVKAVIFDLDGTLLHTLPDLGAGVNAALRRSGLPEHSIEDYRYKIGNGVKVLIRRSLPEGSGEETFETVLADYRAYYPEHCTVHTDYFPGVQDLLRHLKEEDIRLGVLSNKTEKVAHKVMAHYFGDLPWAFVWGNDGVRPLKPALDAGDAICETLGLQPEEIAFVGDGDTDMEFGSKMGFRTIGVTWGYRAPDELKTAGAHVLIDSAEALFDLLTK